MLPDHIKTAIDIYIPALGEWLDLNRAYEMAQLIIDTKPKVVVEIGTFKGQSLITQAFALRENNDGGKIYGIDPWSIESAIEGSNDPDNDVWWKVKIDLDQIHTDCMKQIRAHHLEEWAVVIRSPSQFVHQLFRDIDILYVDGNHSELCSCRDVENYAPRVKQGGWIWMDDTDWPTTQLALARMDHLCSLEKDNGNYRLYRKK